MPVHVTQYLLLPSSDGHLSVRRDAVGQEAQRLTRALVEANIDKCGEALGEEARRFRNRERYDEHSAVVVLLS